MINVDDFSTPRLNMAETSSKFSSSIGNLIESQIFHILNSYWVRLSMMWRIMQIEEEHAIDWVLPASASKYGNRVQVVRI